MLLLSDIGSNDYVTGPYTINILADDTEVTFSVSIYDDNVFESPEYLLLAITQTSKPDRIVIGVIARTVVTILDDDCE